MTDAARSIAETDIQDLQKRLQEFQTKANTDVQAKQEELFQPLVVQVKAAIDAVAKAKGYAYVFNTTSPDLLLVAPPADDLLPAVKLQLGLK
jgi:outer membrane protein